MKTLLFLVFLCGCTQKAARNEISDMTLECFKNKQGITIIFQPQPETKQAQMVEK